MPSKLSLAIGRSRSEFKTSSEFGYFGRNYKLWHEIPPQKLRASKVPNPTSSTALDNQIKLFDVFGSLPQDVQIEVLGFIAAYNPVQIINMRRVCKCWNKILSKDSIYHSALFTASFSTPPEISRGAFEQAAFTDSRIRNLIFSKAKGLKCVANPKKLVYRDGFLVWWTGVEFTYVDFNKTSPASKRSVIRMMPNKFIEAPIYALGGGILVYTMSSKEVVSKKASLSLHAAQLRESPKRGDLDLSNLQHLTGPLELYCSSRYVLVLRDLEILVGDIADVAAMKVIRTIPLHEYTHLSSPTVNTIEVSDSGRCLVILTSYGSAETLAFSLTTGSLLKRYSTSRSLESRDQAHQSQAIYHIQNSHEFAKDIQYQAQNTTHKEHTQTPVGQPSSNNVSFPYRWIEIPPIRGDEDECMTGSYTNSLNRPSQHCVVFPKQGLRFSAFEDNDYSLKSVQWHCLKITEGYIGTESRDSSQINLDDITSPDINKGNEMTSWWSPPALTSPPPDCIATGARPGTYTNLWSQNRQRWSETGILLGDEKALILALPHQLVIWKFQTYQGWRGRKKHRVKYHVNDAIYSGVYAIMCVGFALPLFLACLPCLLVIGCFCDSSPTEAEEAPVASVHPHCHYRPKVQKPTP